MSKPTITLLGTGPAVAIPRLSHRDPTCRDARKQRSRTRRLRSSLLINYNGANLLIDAGPDFLKQVKNIKGDLAAVFLTHEHLDAVGGLYDLNAWAKAKKLKVPLYCLKQTWRKIQDVFTALKPIHAHPGKSIKIKELVIAPFRVRHGIKRNIPTLGFHIAISRNDTAVSFRDKRFFVYASDMDGVPPESRNFFCNAPLVIIDSAMWFGRKLNGHFNPEQAIKFLLPFRPQKVILTQIGHSWPLFHEAAHRLKEYCKKNKIPFPVLAAYDGLKILI